MPHFVYLQRSLRNDRFYIGSSEDPEQRLVFHNAGHVRATRHQRPYQLVYTEMHGTRQEARAREAGLKRQKSRAVLLELINSAPSVSSAG